jgi:ArsR family metal-binding transcriptional regulator
MNNDQLQQLAEEKYPDAEPDKMEEWMSSEIVALKRSCHISGYTDAMKNIEEEYSDEALEEFADAVGEEIALASDASSEVERLRKALADIAAMKLLPGETDHKYAYNRCWRIAIDALKLTRLRP